MGEKDLIGLVYCIYRTIHEPEYWSLILREVQRLMRSDACDLSVYDFEARQGEIALHAGCYDQDLLKRYGQYFAPLNPWLQRRDCYRPEGSTCFGRQIVPHARLVETEFYNEWLRPQGLFHRLSATIASEQHRVVYISLLRGRGTGSFQHEDRKPLQRLAPHLRQALELYSLLVGPGALGANPVTEVTIRLGRAPEVLGIERELRLVDRLGDLTLSLPSNRPHVPGKEGLRWWPIVAANGPSSPGPLTLDLGAASNEGRLARLYKLTAAEARLAVLLACGMSLAKAAGVLGVGMATVRTHLQRIYSKTFTHHQAQLVSLLLLGPARVKVNYQPSEEDAREAG